MKQNLLLKSLLLLLCMMAGGVGSAWADEDYSYTFQSKQFSANGSQTLNGVSWTLSGDGGFWGYDGTKGQQFGSGSSPYKSLSLKTSGISGTITKIEVNASTASSANATISCTVGGAAFGTQSQSLTTSATNYTFSGSASGEIVISMSQTTSKALYIKSIAVTYSTVSYSITAASNNESYGTVSLNGSVITATPANGYTYASPAYTVNPANSATVAQSGNTFTVTPSADTQVTINFEALPTYTVTLADDNSTVAQASYSASVTLPAREAIGNYTFAGWSVTNVESETTTAPSIIPAGDYTPTADITLYPVYTRIEGEGGNINKTASVTIAGYATANSWENGTQYGSITIDGNVTATANGGNNTGKYYSSNESWRIYSSENGSITLNASNGAEFTSATITFGNSTLSYNEKNITSGNAVSLSGESAQFVAGGTTHITAISVSYTISGTGATYYWSAPVPTSGYTVALQENTVDSLKWSAKAGNEGEFKQLPLNGVAEGTLVTIKYDGKKRVKSVKAVTDAPAPQYAPKEPSKVSSR